MRTCSILTWALPSPFLIVILLLVLKNAAGQSECGDYYYINSGTTGNIYSPNYPNDYPTYSKCIWRIEVPSSYRVQLTLTYTGERYDGSCSDYVEIRDGGKYAPLLGQGQYCDSATSEVITSGNIWMWVLFKSDGINGSASVMWASFTPVYNATSPENTTAPFEDCRSFEFQCRNLECLSMSYRCDDYNDCGCTKDCDEDGCGPLEISSGAQIGISLGVGVAVFIAVCLVTYCVERRTSWIATHVEAIRTKEMQAERQRRRASRAFTKFIGDKDALFNKTTPAPRAPAENTNKESDLSVTEYDL